MSGDSAPKRGRTRWLLTGFVLGLTTVVVGIVVLEEIRPEASVDDMVVSGVPPLILDEDVACTRRADDLLTDELRDAFVPGGRISSTQITLCPAAFDGLDVTYVGEVVGELLPRRGGAWAHVNDDAYALEVGPLVGHRERAGFNTGMPVWLPDGLHERIEGVGRPARRGDVILVQGTLHRTDPADAGGTTIRAERMDILAPSVELEDPLHVVQAIVAIVLGLVAVAALVWARATRLR